jgi:hypothetical protein
MLAQSAMTSIWIPAACIVMGLALLGVLVMLVLRTRATQPQPRQESADEELDRLKRAGDRVSLLTAAAEETADALDERINSLRSLLGVADERIDVVERDRERARQPPATGLAQQGSQQGSQLAHAVYELADAGHAPVEIAGRLGEHVGKIELILNLRRSAAARPR